MQTRCCSDPFRRRRSSTTASLCTIPWGGTWGTVWKSIVDGVESTRLRHFVLNRAPRRHRARRVAIEQVASMAQVWNGLIYARKPGNPMLKAVIEFMIEAGPSRWGGVRGIPHHFHYNIDFLWCRRGVLFCSTASRRTHRLSTQGGGQAPLRPSRGSHRTARRRRRLGARGLTTSAKHALVLHDNRPL